MPQAIDRVRRRTEFDTKACSGRLNVELAAKGDVGRDGTEPVNVDRHVESDHETGDPVTASRTHLDLHRTLLEASGNQMVTRIWPLVESQIFMAMNLDQAAFHSPTRDAELHQRLIDVIASGDESAIIAEVRDLIGRSAEQVVHLIGSAGTKRKGGQRRR